LGAHPPGSPAFEATTRSLRIDRLTAEVVESFAGAGIRSILLKGPAIARWLYDEGAMRPYADCDLLVREDQSPSAQRILIGLGLQREALDSIPGDWPKHASTWRRGDGASVDLHVTLVGLEVPPRRVWEVLAERTDRMRVGGAGVEVLTPAARVLLVALNAAKDAVRVGKVRHDLGHALDRVPVETWAEARALAGRLDATAAFAAGLRRVPAGAELADRLGLPFDRPPSAIAIRERPPPPMAVGLDWLLSTPGWKGKVALMFRKIVPPPSFMRAWTPMATRGVPGLALSYLWRPLWIAWRAGPALRAWWKVRRRRR
jgi:hypothetical protein